MDAAALRAALWPATRLLRTGGTREESGAEGFAPPGLGGVTRDAAGFPGADFSAGAFPGSGFSAAAFSEADFSAAGFSPGGFAAGACAPCPGAPETGGAEGDEAVLSGDALAEGGGSGAPGAWAAESGTDGAAEGGVGAPEGTDATGSAGFCPSTAVAGRGIPSSAPQKNATAIAAVSLRDAGALK